MSSVYVKGYCFIPPFISTRFQSQRWIIILPLLNVYNVFLFILVLVLVYYTLYWYFHFLSSVLFFSTPFHFIFPFSVWMNWIVALWEFCCSFFTIIRNESTIISNWIMAMTRFWVIQNNANKIGVACSIAHSYDARASKQYTQFGIGIENAKINLLDISRN